MHTAGVRGSCASGSVSGYPDQFANLEGLLAQLAGGGQAA